MLLTTRAVRMLTRIAISSIVFIVFALHVAASPRFEIIDRMENYPYDVRVRATMPGGIDERIVIVDIDEASQLQFGQWPWARATLAGIVDTLFDDYGIKTLGFDVLFAEAERADGNYLDYISAEHAFMAVQMLVIELDDPYLEDQLDRIADTLNNDERYRPSQFAAMLAALAAPGSEVEDIDEQDE